MSRLTKPRTQTPRGMGALGGMPLQRPGDMFTDERGRMIGARAQCRNHHWRLRCVAQRDRDVAQPPLVADAADGRAFEAAIEFVLGPREELDQCRAVEPVAGLE